jgi:hypothetical protein
MCMVVVIILAITIVPGLVADLQETLNTQKSGAGSYTRSKNPYVIVCGNFNSITRLRNTLNCILDSDKSEDTRVVLLSRNVLDSETKLMLAEPDFRYRVIYLAGRGLEVEDLSRIDLRHAAASFILASDSDNDQLEDEQNVLRAWGFDDYSPMTPLYVQALSPETANLLERTCDKGYHY